MERNFMGLDSKDAIFNKDLELEGCKQPDVFESFNNHPEREIEVAQVQHATKPAVPVTMSNPFYRPVFSGAPVYSQLLNPWYGSKVASVPAQLTIFYDGMVYVYDDISPEKAQAIMRLAGNGHFVATADAPQQRTQAQGPAPTSPASPRPCSPVSSPMSVSSHYVGPLTDGPHSETEAAKRIMSSLGQAMQSAIPQARQASLARFLEKRKERVMASAPYSLGKNIMDCASNGNAAVVAGE
ncbi:putative transcription factor TIFY family [Helianthus annuus]|uniref:Protein TIFY n=1 Tax=Helianthus annuus TaxID=4232 RepID=A0A251RU85_HELAN|nr:protein TIFY 6A isoform X1 [Helianthus annuus]KAF5778637.1 putative transcription factor TIFY family [Helianthus annuus]KAJ0494065.1 putative transcription factor TIFY family [Helianthus annuus]KAJ0678870.1 putative transcription factor TIFY family [Helianthus annuus]KAJ0863384.1 putative transcription factor TIFY family [Helianthus annuus]